jgi:outer membrane autotransporter protein
VVEDRQSRLEADSVQAGAYGAWLNGPLSLSAALALSSSHITTERRIAFGDIDRIAAADYLGHSIGFSGEASYGFDLGGGTTIAPLFTLDVGWSGHGGFTETGADALNLTGAAESWMRLDTGFGVALTHAFETEAGRVTLDGRLVWEHAFADVVPTEAMTLAGGPAGFTVAGPSAGRDRLRIGAGVSVEATQGLAIRASYEGIVSASQHSHIASVGIKASF